MPFVDMYWPPTTEWIHMSGSHGGLFPITTVMKELASSLPFLINLNAEKLGLDPEATPVDGVQVTAQPYPTITVNGAGLWIKFTIVESVPLEVRQAQRKGLWQIISTWFADRGLEPPYDTMIDILIVDGHGIGCVNGTHVQYP